MADVAPRALQRSAALDCRCVSCPRNVHLTPCQVPRKAAWPAGRCAAGSPRRPRPPTPPARTTAHAKHYNAPGSMSRSPAASARTALWASRPCDARGVDGFTALAQPFTVACAATGRQTGTGQPGRRSSAHSCGIAAAAMASVWVGCGGEARGRRAGWETGGPDGGSGGLATPQNMKLKDTRRF